jgi:hypothetical protein
VARHEAVSAARTGSIFDGYSPRGQEALAQLRAAFQRTGFQAEKERATERSLRVYPFKRGRYPLLNPSLLRAGTTARPGVVLAAPTLWCPAYSDGDAAVATHLLATPDLPRWRFVRLARRIGRYHEHGAFVLALPFTTPARREVAWARLDAPLRALHLYLTSQGFAAPA